MAPLSDLLHGGPVTEDEVARVRDVVVFEQPGLQTKLIRFAILLVLASAISTYGLLSDSVATIIGAMIVAPLMLPIMGVAFGISIGDRRAVVTSLFVGVCGAAAAVLVGYVLSLVMPSTFNPESVGQIMSRTSPRLIDLLAALATGLAGAFAIGRSDVSDTLPGVAIAISLVPPLANAGILFASGDSNLAFGSLLLFVTNYLAIVLTGALVFGLMGFPQVAFVGHSRRARQVGVATVLLLLLVVAIPLALSSQSVLQTNTEEATASSEVTSWLGGTDYEFVSATAGDNSVEVVVAGTGELPSVSTLEASLKGRLNGLPAVINVVDSQRITVDTE